MSWRPSFTTLLAGVGAAAALAMGCLLDWIKPNFAEQMPVTANVVAGAVLVPAEIFVVYGIVDRLLSRRRQQRWASVAAELAQAIGKKWSDLRELLHYMRRLDDHPDGVPDSEVVITRAESVWEALRLQDEAQPYEVRGTADAQWDLPDGCDEALGDVLGVWIQMWPAGLDTERKALQRRLASVLLPRLAVDDPELTSAARLLVDAMNDLDDLLQGLNEVEEPFPMSPYWSPDVSELSDADLDMRPMIPHGAPECALGSLRELRRALHAMDQLIERGDRLIKLLTDRRR
ncbi:hypothetical protein [Micromonospora siamensis]|uniref:hypothetical protein n=1 Tax=Micromonospora siamensis TaxID=299152 RepID=UPI000B5AE787|nr:hypothetical protein [Micromonospora siamensis]